MESLKASMRVNAELLELNAAAIEEETRAGRVSPELLAQAMRLRERSAETDREYMDLARKRAEVSDLASALWVGHRP